MRIRLALLAVAAALPVLAVLPAHAAPDLPVDVTITPEYVCVTVSKQVPQCVPLYLGPIL